MNIKYIFFQMFFKNVFLHQHEVLCIARIISHILKESFTQKLKSTHPQAIQQI